eukprot:g1207.t1
MVKKRSKKASLKGKDRRKK